MTHSRYDSVAGMAATNGAAALTKDEGRAIVAHTPMEHQYPLVNGEKRVVAIDIEPDDPEGEWVFRMSTDGAVTHWHSESWTDACSVVYAALRAGFENEDDDLNDIFTQF